MMGLFLKKKYIPDCFGHPFVRVYFGTGMISYNLKRDNPFLKNNIEIKKKLIQAKLRYKMRNFNNSCPSERTPLRSTSHLFLRSYFPNESIFSKEFYASGRPRMVGSIKVERTSASSWGGKIDESGSCYLYLKSFKLNKKINKISEMEIHSIKKRKKKKNYEFFLEVDFFGEGKLQRYYHQFDEYVILLQYLDEPNCKFFFFKYTIGIGIYANPLIIVLGVYTCHNQHGLPTKILSVLGHIDHGYDRKNSSS